MDKLTVKNLDLYYGQFQALKNINLDMREKEITAFIGPSGCGKSTLLKTLNRMNDLVEGCRIEGEVKLDGENIYKDMDVNLLRKRVGMVFQKPNPFPMSVYDNIAYGPRTHGIRSKVALDEIVEKSLRDAAIWDEVKDRLKKSALGLSGGILAGVFNSLAVGMSPDNVIAGPIVMVLIFVIGHAINMFMNVLGAMVHPMRLTFVEFFKNSGYEGGGKEYKPFRNLE